MVSSEQIACAIRQVRSDYISTGVAPSHWAINDGMCDDFASAVTHSLGGETDALYGVEGGNFMVAGDALDGGWDWQLLESHWGIITPAGLKKSQVDGISFGAHVWLTDGKRHYDAECPQGVESFFDLPVFRRCVVEELRRMGVACDDVVTDDVLPSPSCPIENPQKFQKRPRMRA